VVNKYKNERQINKASNRYDSRTAVMERKNKSRHVQPTTSSDFIVAVQRRLSGPSVQDTIQVSIQLHAHPLYPWENESNVRLDSLQSLTGLNSVRDIRSRRWRSSGLCR
jgi:hypothetical protein